MSSYAGNYLVFGVVNADYSSLRPSATPRFPGSFPDGMSQTALFVEKYAVSKIPADAIGTGKGYAGGCQWAYFQGDCNAPLFAYHYPLLKRTDPGALGPTSAADPRDSRFQVQPPAERCHPCLPSTAHNSMNACMADGSVRALDRGMSRPAWWALVTPAGGDVSE